MNNIYKAKCNLIKKYLEDTDKWLFRQDVSMANHYLGHAKNAYLEINNQNDNISLNYLKTEIVKYSEKLSKLYIAKHEKSLSRNSPNAEYWLKRAEEVTTDFKQCFCVGPQNGEPVCPCRMKNIKIENGRVLEVNVIDHGPVNDFNNIFNNNEKIKPEYDNA